MRLPALLLTACCGLAASAQTTGTEHWLAYMENLTLAFNGPPAFRIVISSDFDTDGDITFPATGFSIPFSVAAGSDTVIQLPPNVYYPEGDEDIVNFGMRISADEAVSVYAYHDRVYFSEATLVLPYTQLASSYTVLAHEDALGADPSEFVVLATEDSTVVEIIPSILTAGLRPPGVPFTVLLNEGQVYQIQAVGDLSGTRVRALDPNKRLALFAGARQANVGCTDSADDHLYNVVLPLDLWSLRYIAVPFKNRGGDEFRILSSADGTTVNVGSQPAVTLDAGEVLSVDLNATTVILASEPIALGQFNESQNCNPAPGDPCFLWNLSPAHEDTRFIWSSLDTGTPEHFVNAIVTGSTVVPPVFLDGVNISAQFLPVPGAPGFHYAQITTTAGEHELTCNNGVWATAYGFGDYNSYSFSLGFEMVIGGATGLDEPLGPERSLPVWFVQPGNAWPTGLFDADARRLQVFEPSGRLVMEVTGNSRTAGVALGEGLYFFMALDADGRRVSAGRLVVAR